MNRQIYKMTLSDASDSITFYLLEVPIADDDITGTARNTTIDGNVYEDYLWLKKQWSQKWSIMCKDEYDKLRGIWKRQYTDSEVVSVKYFYGDNIFTDGEADGANFQITNDSETYEGELKTFSLLGNTTQTTLSGKNLAPFTNQDFTLNGIRYYAQNGNLFLNGTCTSETLTNHPQFKSNFAFTLDAGTYTFSMSSNGTLRPMSIKKSADDTNLASLSSTQLYSHFTLVQQTQVYFGFYMVSGNSYSNTQYYIQCESGTTKTDYEPYTGSTSSQITPSPNPDYPQTVNVVSGEQTVQIVGKNLFSAEQAVIDSNNATTFITADGEWLQFRTSGNRLIYNFPQKAGTTFTITTIAKTIEAGNNGFNLQIMYADGTTETLFSQQLGDGAEHTNTATKTLAKDMLYLRTAYTDSKDTQLKIAGTQLELGNQATTYEPYQGQSYEINLGKNLFDIKGFLDARSATYTEASDGTLTITGIGALYTSPLKFSDEDITVSLQGIIANLTASNVRIQLLNSASTVVGEINSSTPTVSNIKASSLRFNWSSTGTFTVKNVQLEAGLATSYSPYKTPMKLCKIGTYQDYIYKSGDKWYKHAEVGKASISLGTTVYTLTGGYKGSTYAPANKIYEFSAGAYCEKATRWTAGAYWAGCFYENAANFMFVGTSTDDSASLKAKYDGSAIYFILATPTDTEITDSELVGQLEALLAGSLYKGLNNVFLIPSAGAQGTMELSYRLWYEKETTVVPTTPVLLDLTDDGIINACQCRQNVKITMRETVQ